MPSLKRSLGCRRRSGSSLAAHRAAQRLRRRWWFDAADDHHPAVDVLHDRVDDGAGCRRAGLRAAPAGGTVAGTQVYEVQSGDFLSGIADDYGIPPESIANFNQWEDGIEHVHPPGPADQHPAWRRRCRDADDEEDSGDDEDSEDDPTRPRTTRRPRRRRIPTIRAVPTVTRQGTYTIEEGDIPANVAESLDVTVDQLNEANANTPGYGAFIVGARDPRAVRRRGRVTRLTRGRAGTAYRRGTCAGPGRHNGHEPDRCTSPPPRLGDRRRHAGRPGRRPSPRTATPASSVDAAGAVPSPITDSDVAQAGIGVMAFGLRNLAVDPITEPCPVLRQDQIGWYFAQQGLHGRTSPDSASTSTTRTRSARDIRASTASRRSKMPSIPIRQRRTTRRIGAAYLPDGITFARLPQRIRGSDDPHAERPGSRRGDRRRVHPELLLPPLAPRHRWSSACSSPVGPVTSPGRSPRRC